MGKTVGNLDKHIQIDLSNFSVNGHTHDYTTWVGDHAEAATSNTANSPYTGMAKSTTKGLYLTGSYNDANTPATFGNILNLAGRGTGQLLCEWKSGTTSSTGDLYYRSHRDNSEAPWGPWKKIAYTDSNITGNAATATSAGKLTTARTLTIGNTGKAFDGSANVAWSLSEIGAAASAHSHTILESVDTRNTNGLPNSYKVRGITPEFKSSSTIGLPNTNSNYAGVLTYQQWADVTNWSGGKATQFATIDDGRMYYRKGDGSGWGSWYQFYTTQNKPTYSDVGAAAASHGTHVTWSTTAPKVAGTAAVGTETKVARGDHVHAAQTSVSGNAGTATKLATARNIAIGNKTNSFDGSANITYTLADIGAAASNHTHGLLHDNLTVTLSNTTEDSGWSMINSSYSGFLLKSIRTNSSAPSWICNDYSAGIAFGGSDTKGVISTKYSSPSIKFAGGNGTKPVWWIGLTGTSGTSYNLANFENKNHGTHVTYSTSTPLVAGTASVGSAANVARGDHVHPAQTSVSGNAGTATKLATARTLTIGSKGKTFDGSANVSWTLSEIGAAAASHTHNVLSVKNDNFKKASDLPSTYERGETLFFSNNQSGTDAFNGLAYGLVQTLKEYSSGPAAWQFLYPYNAATDTFYVRNAQYNTDSWRSWAEVYTSLNKPTPADIGAAASSHTHAYLPTAGGTMTGVITTPNNAQGIKVGDDAVICDRNIANHIVIEGATATNGGITFGSGKDTNIYRGGANLLKTDDTFNAVGGFQWNGTSLDSRYSAASHTHNQINSRGNVTAETEANRPAVNGLSMANVYNNGYPTTYGNVMTMKGTGDGQLLIGWSGTSGAHAPAYIRSRRDTTDANWSGWAQIYTTAHKPTPADLGLQREYKSAVVDIYSSGITTGGSTLAADTYASHGKSYSFASTTTATVIYKAAFPELKYGKYAICVRMMSSNNTSTSNIAKIEILQGTTIKKTVNITGKNFTSTSNYSYIYTDFEYTGDANAKQSLSIQVSSLTVSGITLKFDYASIEMMSPAVFL